MSEYGRKEIKGISGDIKKLMASAARHGFLIVFSCNPIDDPTCSTEVNVRSLEEQIFEGMEIPERMVHSFPTLSAEGHPNEFWVAGWQVK